jgi:hypothetical protein
MSDITSFNALFCEAARRGLRLNRFDQDSAGLFRANWRRDVEGPLAYSHSERSKFFPVAEHTQPFLAVLNAYVMADLQATEATVSDLFG